MASSVEANMRWRENNPELWQAQKRRNYALGKPATAKPRYPWTEEEDRVIMKVDRPDDRYLAKLLNRSVQSIQARRCKLLKISRSAKTHTPGD